MRAIAAIAVLLSAVAVLPGAEYKARARAALALAQVPVSKPFTPVKPPPARKTCGCGGDADRCRCDYDCDCRACNYQRPVWDWRSNRQGYPGFDPYEWHIDRQTGYKSKLMRPGEMVAPVFQQQMTNAYIRGWNQGMQATPAQCSGGR